MDQCDAVHSHNAQSALCTHRDHVRLGRHEELDVAGADVFPVLFHGGFMRCLVLELYQGLACAWRCKDSFVVPCWELLAQQLAAAGMARWQV